MRILLDTQALLWYCAGDSRFSDEARAVIEDENNERLLSIASLWEIALKYRLGKLELADPFEKFVARAINELRCSLLDISVAHAAKTTTLQFHHRDPFDRMLIAQSLSEGIDVVSSDATWDVYGVNRRW